MKSILKISLLPVALFLGAFSLRAQPFTSGVSVTDAELSGRAWHISSKLDDNPLLSEWFGGVAVVNDFPLNEYRTFIIEDGPNDGDGWTADVRWFHIRNRANGKYLTVEGTEAGSAVGWENYNGTQGTSMWKQQFRLTGGALNWYKLLSRLSQNGPDLVLSVGSNGGIFVEHPDVDPAPEQKFAFNLAMPFNPSENYMIVGINNNDFMSDKGISSENSPAVHIESLDYSCYWNFSDAGDGYYYIKNALTGNYLSNNGSTTAGDALYMNHAGSDGAKWELLRDRHTFSFKNKTSGYQISTKGQTATGQPLYQSTASGIGLNWALIPVLEVDPQFLPTDVHHMLENAAPLTDCIFYGPEFKKAICERAGLPADEAYFPLVLDALTTRFGNADLVTQALQNFDMNSTGHRTELAFAMRQHILITLAHKPPVELTPLETAAMNYFEGRINTLRSEYADALAVAWADFETSFGLNNGNPLSFSQLLDNLDASDFVWPDEYEPNSYQQTLMQQYAGACEAFNLKNDHSELGINIALTLEPLIAPGVALALHFAITEGTIALLNTVTLDFTLTAEAVQAAQAATRAIVAGASNAGGAATVALVAIQLIIQEALDIAEVQRLENRINDKIAWGHLPVSIYGVMHGNDELAKIRIVQDMDFLVAAPVENGFQYNTNDNQHFAPFNIYCQSVTVEIGQNGSATLQPQAIAGFVTAYCGDSVSLQLSKNLFDCSNYGANTVFLTAANNIHSENCNATVNVVDHIPPTVVCKNATVNLTTGGTFIGIATVYQSGTDNCGFVQATGLSKTSFNCDDIGANIVTLTANDGHGNTGTCNATVTIVDNTPPALVCKNKIVGLDANGQANIVTADMFQSGTDNCGTVNQQSVTPNTFTCSNYGNNGVTLVVNDGHGNNATCNATVTVVDNLAPTVVCKNKTVALDANGQASIASGDVFQSAADNCGTVNQQSVTPNTFTCSNYGVNTVVLSVNDGHGNNASCNATVTVVDLIAPTVVCKNATINLDASGVASLPTASVFLSGADNCAAVNPVSVTPNTFNCNNLGANAVTLMVNDGHGNNASCNATVTVADATAPTMICQNLSLNLNAAGTASITLAQVNNGSLDNCAINTMNLSQTTFSCANIGANNVTLSGTDISGNKGQCNAVVTVVDGIAPTAFCKNATVQLSAAGVVTVPASSINNGSGDNCSFGLTLTPATFSCANVGANIVTLKATDAGGNTATCSAMVTVQDITAPTALCKNPIVFLNSNGQATITAAQIDNGSSDACGINYMAINTNSFNCGDLAGSPVYVQLTLKDVNNNIATCLSQVTVKDNSAPVAVCQNTTVQLNAQGKATVYGANLASGSYDNCAVWSFSPATKLYTTANLGVNNLAITVKDWSNNSATCIAQVTVVPYGSFGNQNLAVDTEHGMFEEGMALSVYPNPADRNVTLSVQLQQDQSLHLRLFDATGRILLSDTMEGVQGENVLPLDLGDLPAGLYVIDVQSTVLREQKRLVIQR